MGKPMTARERILLTIAVCLTILVAAPVAALAATGQLVNIVDPSNAARAAKVTAIGAVQVQARLGIPSGTVNWQFTLGGGGGYMPLGSVVAPNGLAITDVTAHAVGAEGTAFVTIYVFSVDAAATCPVIPMAGKLMLRRLLVPLNTQAQLLLPSPVFVGPSTGKRKCFTALAQGGPDDDFYVALGGYTYAP